MVCFWGMRSIFEVGLGMGLVLKFRGVSFWVGSTCYFSQIDKLEAVSRSFKKNIPPPKKKLTLLHKFTSPYIEVILTYL